MKCPLCRSQQFYVKDPEDEYELYPFDCSSGSICFDPEVDLSRAPVIADETETFCNQCAWHGKYRELN